MFNQNNRTQYSRRYVALLLLLLAGGALSVLVSTLSQNQETNSIAAEGQTSPVVGRNGIDGPVLFGFSLYIDMPQLIEESDAVVIADVGDILSREYPGLNEASEYTEDELANLGGEDFLKSDPYVYHQVNVVERIKGEVPDTFPLLRIDVEHYAVINLSRLKPGERVLLFLEYVEDDEVYVNYDSFYTAFDDNGIFDLEGNRAYPRAPLAFENNTDEYFKNEGVLVPYFELDKLRVAVQDK